MYSKAHFGRIAWIPLTKKYLFLFAFCDWDTMHQQCIPLGWNCVKNSVATDDFPWYCGMVYDWIIGSRHLLERSIRSSLESPKF